MCLYYVRTSQQESVQSSNEDSKQSWKVAKLTKVSGDAPMTLSLFVCACLLGLHYKSWLKTVGVYYMLRGIKIGLKFG